MKIFTHISVLALAIWSFPLWAGTPMSVESASSGTTDVKPYSGEFFCRCRCTGEYTMAGLCTEGRRWEFE